GEGRLGGGGGGVDIESEVRLQRLERRGRPKRVHAQHPPFTADVALPAKSRGEFHTDARPHGRGQDLFAITRVLGAVVFENLPGGHAHDAGGDAVGLQLLVGLQGERHFATRRQQQYVRL